MTADDVVKAIRHFYSGKFQGSHQGVILLHAGFYHQDLEWIRRRYEMAEAEKIVLQLYRTGRGQLSVVQEALEGLKKKKYRSIDD